MFMAIVLSRKQNAFTTNEDILHAHLIAQFICLLSHIPGKKFDLREKILLFPQSSKAKGEENLKFDLIRNIKLNSSKCN